MSCVRAKNLGLQNKSDACPLPVVVSRMTEASCSIRPPWNSGSSAERGMATSRPPPAREVPTGTNRPGRARVLCLPRDPALLAPWARAACLASVGSVPRDRPAACPARAWAASLPASVRCSQPPARGRAVPVPRCLRACSTRWCRALERLLRAMVPRLRSLSARDGAARWRACCARWCLHDHAALDGAARLRAVVARWCRALACLLRAMVPRTGAHAARDGAARWRACCARWCRGREGAARWLACCARWTCARWRPCCARWCRALAPMLRSMVPRACALLSRDGAARWLACCARWCRALAPMLRAMVPRAGAHAARDVAARVRAVVARWCCAMVACAGALAARFRWSFLARREVSCAGNGLPMPTCRCG